MKPVIIIDLNSGNLLSLENALSHKDQSLSRIQQPNAYNFTGDEILVLPGQGRFAFIAERMNDLGWRGFLTDWLTAGGHLVGICVGMQILFEGSAEDPEARGLGYFDGRCERLKHPKTPMVGWAKLDSYKLNMKDQYAYFVNSYGVPDCNHATAKVIYGEPFCAAVQKGRVYGFQFHPEKSGLFGRELLQLSVAQQHDPPSRLVSEANQRRSARSSMKCSPRSLSLLSGTKVNEAPRTHLKPVNKYRSDLTARIIPCLDVAAGRVVKGTNFKQLIDMGDPVKLALKYEQQGADELVFLDIKASVDKQPSALAMVRKVAMNLSIPFAVGGGIKTMEDVHRFFTPVPIKSPSTPWPSQSRT